MVLKNGDVLIHKKEQMGYFMIMGYKKGVYRLSSLFGWEKIVIQEVEHFYVEHYYKKIESTKHMIPLIQARYDHEYMRRINKL